MIYAILLVPKYPGTPAASSGYKLHGECCAYREYARIRLDRDDHVIHGLRLLESHRFCLSFFLGNGFICEKLSGGRIHIFFFKDLGVRRLCIFFFKDLEVRGCIILRI